MTISRRLKLSYIALVVVPFIVFILTSTYSLQNLMEGINELKLTIQTPEFNRELYTLMSSNPDSLLEPETLHKLNKLTDYGESVTSYVVIDEEVVAKFGEDLEEIQGELHTQKYLNYWIFNLEDGRTATIFFVIKGLNGANFRPKLFLPIVFYIVLISLLTFLTGRKITKPLAKLKNAAISIKNEEFDLNLDYTRVDEIKDVFIAFDEMRLRLKQNSEKQLLYEKNRTELIANISHDLKTPITSIKGYIEGILDGVANTPEKLNRYHTTILKKVNILDRLIENLFLSSKLELGSVPFHFRKISINSFISDITEEIKYDYPTLELNFKKLPGDIFISADSIQLQRVMQNIIGNSVKYSDKDICKVDISLSVDEHYISISISDNGRGILDTNIDKIFQQFYRSDPARSSSTKGSGLGLSITKQIINEHNGDIKAFNNDIHGLTVEFKLPIIREV